MKSAERLRIDCEMVKVTTTDHQLYRLKRTYDRLYFKYVFPENIVGGVTIKLNVVCCVN